MKLSDLKFPSRSEWKWLLVNAIAREIMSEDDKTRFSITKFIYNDLRRLGFCERDACWMAVGDKGA